MKKWITLILALGMVLSLFAACGGSADSTPASSAPADEADASAASEEAAPADESADATDTPAAGSIEYPVGNGETYTISVVMDDNLLNYVPDQNPANANGIRQMQDVTGINLDYSVYAMMSEELSLAIMSGSYTDIYCKINENYNTGLEGALNDEVIIDLTPYMDLAPDYMAQVKSDPIYEKYCYTDDGHMGAFMNFSIPNIAGWAIRGDWLEEAGIADVPETYDELHDALKAIMDKHPEVESGVALGQSFIAEGYDCDLTMGYGFTGGFNSFFRNEDGKVQYIWSSDNARNYLAMMADWVKDGILSKDMIISGDIASYGTYVYTGQAVAKHNGSNMWGNEMLAIAEDENFNLVPMNEPTVNKGDALRVGAGQKNASPGWSLSCDCHDVEILVQAINWLYTEEGKIAMNFGEEGVSYTKDESGYHFTDAVLNNPDGVQMFMAVALYTGFEAPTIGMQEQANAKLSNQMQLDAEDFWRTQNRGTEGTVQGSLTSEENDKVSEVGLTDIDTFVKENAMAFASGEKEITDESWNAYISTIESMGIADIEACYQAAQDRWDAK